MPVFKLLCDEMGREHTTMLLRTEIRWLSREEFLLEFRTSFGNLIFLLLITHFIFLTVWQIHLDEEVGIISSHCYKN